MHVEQLFLCPKRLRLDSLLCIKYNAVMHASFDQLVKKNGCLPTFIASLI